QPARLAARLLRSPGCDVWLRLKVSFYVLEFARVGLVSRWQPAQLLNFLVNQLDAVFRAWVAGEEIGRPPSFSLGLQLLKKLRHRPRIVVVIVEDLCARQVCLALGIAGEL